MDKDSVQHWNSVYSVKPVDQLGWYEANPALSLELLNQCGLEKDDPILEVGAGATTFVDYLLAAGYQKIIALDISQVALDHLKQRLGEEKTAQIQWVTDDVTHPTRILAYADIALWHDRACLHFMTEDSQQRAYVELLKKLLRPGGYAIISAFAIGGATKCSGLDVKNYDEASLVRLLGEDFELRTCRYYTYTMPSGDLRPYVSALFYRKKTP